MRLQAPLSSAVLAAVSILAAPSLSSPAQCANVWVAGYGVPWVPGYVPPGGPDGWVNALHVFDPDGFGPAPVRLVAGGSFQSAGGVTASCLAALDLGTGAWAPLGGGVTNVGLSDRVAALATLPNGDLVAGGRFVACGGVPAVNIARWDGVAWSPLGIGLPDEPVALAVLPNGDLVAGGSFPTGPGSGGDCVRKWTGAAWQPLGSGLPFTNVPWGVNAFALLPNGDLIAGGAFFGAGGITNVARWDGASWSALGALGLVRALAVLPDGTPVAGGDFGAARWTGSTWQPLGGLGGTTTIQALAVLADGRLAASGPSTMFPYLAEWDGANWLPLGGGVAVASGSGVLALATLPDGDLVAGGEPFTAGGALGCLARLTTTCPAAAAPFGSGCSTATSAPTLAALTLPWLGASYQRLASGLPGNALLLEATGLATTAVPLPSILPPGVPGCSLLVTPDLLDLYVPTTSSLVLQWTLPASASLAGVVLFQQVAPIELGGPSGIAAVTASNGLAATTGSF